MLSEEASRLESELRARLQRALRHNSSWGKPFGKFINLVRQKKLTAFLFGGTIRDLLIHGPTQPPRDLDIVVNEETFDFFLHDFQADSVSRNRFGGLKCKFNTVEIDVWPLQSTWAFRMGYRPEATFRALPTTAFYNLDAVVSEIAPPRGRPRQIYESCFFEGIAKHQIDHNLTLTEFPELNAVRGFVLAQQTRFHFSNRLCKLLLDIYLTRRDIDFEAVQLKHYRRVKLPQTVLADNFERMRKLLNTNTSSTFLPYFPSVVQRDFAFEF